MNAIEKLRQARNKDELAREIEPLAQALAALADDTRQALSEQLEASKQQAEAWSQAQAKTAESWQKAAKNMREAAQTLDQAAENSKRATRSWTWRVWVLTLSVSVIASTVAPSAYVLWQNHYSETAQDAKGWQGFLNKYQTLTEKDQATLRKIMGW